MERIQHEKGNPEAWLCACGNRPDSDGFLVCDASGNEVEPDREWTGLYLCNRCGRVIEQESLKVVGRAPVRSEPRPVPPRARGSAGGQKS